MHLIHTAQDLRLALLHSRDQVALEIKSARTMALRAQAQGTFNGLTEAIKLLDIHIVTTLNDQQDLETLKTLEGEERKQFVHLLKQSGVEVE